MDCWTAAPERQRFSARVESDDPRKWPDLLGARAVKTLQLSGKNVVVDESGKPLYRFVITPLAGTPLADRGYVGIFEQRIGFSPDGKHWAVDPTRRCAFLTADTTTQVIWSEPRQRRGLTGSGCESYTSGARNVSASASSAVRFCAGW